MLRSIIGLMLLAIAGNSWAESRMPNLGVGNFRQAMSVFLQGNSDFPGGIAGGTDAFLSGQITRGFDLNRNGFSGFVVLLTQDTPAEFFGSAAQQSFDGFYDTLLPFYEALDGPAEKFASFSGPFAKPFSNAIVSFARVFDGNGGAVFARSFASSGLPGLPGND